MPGSFFLRSSVFQYGIRVRNKRQDLLLITGTGISKQPYPVAGGGQANTPICGVEKLCGELFK